MLGKLTKFHGAVAAFVVNMFEFELLVPAEGRTGLLAQGRVKVVKGRRDREDGLEIAKVQKKKRRPTSRFSHGNKSRSHCP